RCFPTSGPAANTANSTTRRPPNAFGMEGRFKRSSPPPGAPVLPPLTRSRLRKSLDCVAQLPAPGGNRMVRLRKTSQMVPETSLKFSVLADHRLARSADPEDAGLRECRVH